MPKMNKQGNMVMTEEEARQQLEAMGMQPPSQKKSQSQSNNQNKSNLSSPTTAKGKGQGWWNEPLRHALSARGIQTAMTGKTEMEDLGSVYYPSDSYKKGITEIHSDIKADSLKDILKRLYHDPTLYDRLTEEVQSWVQTKLGGIFTRYESQKSRNQLDSGNFKCPKADYELLKEFENGMREDMSTIRTWYEEMKSKHQTKLNTYEQKLKDYSNDVKSKTDSPERYRKAVNDKMSEYQFELNQSKADIEYAEHILHVLETTQDKVKNLYNKATIDTNGSEY